MFLLQCPCFLTLNHFILFLSSAFSSLSPSYFYSRMPLSMHSKAFHIYWCHLSSKQWTKIINSAAAAQSLQSCQTLSNPIDRSPPGSPVPGILQARTLEWVAISFSNAWKWKVKVKSLSRVRLLATPWTAAYQAPPSMGFSRQEYGSGVPLPSLKWMLDLIKAT